jgi:hypothetical protein
MMNVVVVIILNQDPTQVEIHHNKRMGKGPSFFFSNRKNKSKSFRKRISRSPSNEHQPATSSNGGNHRVE